VPVRLGAVPRPLRRFAAGARPEDAVRVAAELVAGGRRVALEPVPGRGDEAAAGFDALAARIRAAGLAASCELTVPVDRLGVPAARRLAQTVGFGVVLAGPADDVDAVAAELPGVGIVVPAGESAAEARCRHLAAGHVRLVSGRGADADLSFVRCLNVLMAADGRPAVATADLRLIAIAGERAAWNGRTPESWEHVMPFGVRTAEQHRMVAAGLSVRVAVPSGRGAAAAVTRSLVGRPRASVRTRAKSGAPTGTRSTSASEESA
jgi:proline dehydrogenase